MICRAGDYRASYQMRLYFAASHSLKVEYPTKGYTLPVIGGINLNPDASQVLATYHPENSVCSKSEFFADAPELPTAFCRQSEHA